MGTIHQVYATHCTYGTSAIERRMSGDSKDRVLGYSARASSFDQSDLRRHFRTIERFLCYYLPKETPPDKKQKLTPQDAPHRMFFCPSLSGLQAVGYISYRQMDRAGRIGSYFAHVLTSEIKPAEPPWDVIDCLQLWNASGWMTQDSDALTYDLPSASKLSALRNGKPVPTDEKVLWSFLNTPTQGEFCAPEPTVIPERWQKMSVDERRKRFRQALMGYLEIADQPRESLLLLAEPAVAVLFFYGIARLLPPMLRKSLSFSTFETNADRLMTSLAAYTFDNELDGGDLPPERYRRGFVVNTWEYKASELRAPDAKYADFVLASLVGVPEQDAPTLARSIDGKLARFQGLELQRVADLEDVVQANTVCEQVLRLTPNVDHTAWSRKPAQKVFIRKAVRQRLAGAADAAYLDQILKSPEYLPLMLEIAVQGEGDDNCGTSIAYLVERIKSQLDSVPDAGLNMLFRCVVRASIDPHEKREILGRIADRPKFDVVALMPALQPEISAQGPLLKAVLMPPLQHALNRLHAQPARFAVNLAGLEPALPLLAGEPAKPRVEGWMDLKRILESAQREKQSQVGVRVKNGERWEFTDSVSRCLDRCFSKHDDDCDVFRTSRFDLIKPAIEQLTRAYGVDDLLTGSFNQYLWAVLTDNRNAQTKLRQTGAMGTLLEHPWRIAAGLAALVLAVILLKVGADTVLSLFPGRGETEMAGLLVTDSGEGQQKTDAKPVEREPEPADSTTSPPSSVAKPSEEPLASSSDAKAPSPPHPKTPPQFPIAEEPQEGFLVSREAAGPWRLGQVENNVADLTLHLHGCELLNCTYKYNDGKQGKFTDAKAERQGETGGKQGLDIRASRETGERVKIASIDVGNDGAIRLQTSSLDIFGFFDAQQFLRFCVLEIRDKTTDVPQQYIALQKPRQIPDGFQLEFDGTKMRSEATLQLEPGDAPPGETKFSLGSGRLKGFEDFGFGGGALTQSPSDQWFLPDFFEKKGLASFAGDGLTSVHIRVSKSGEGSLLLAVETEPEFTHLRNTKATDAQLAEKASMQNAVEIAFRNLAGLAADVYRIVEVPNRKAEGKMAPVRVLMIRGSQE